MRVRFQPQSEHSECGLACVAMMLDYFVKDVQLVQLRERYGVPNGGYNLFQLKTILEDYGLSARSVRCNNIKFLGNLPTPFMAFWNNTHFIVIEKIVREKYYMIDPATGRKKIEKSEFNQHFSNVVLYVKDKKCKRIRHFNINRTIVKLISSHRRIIFKTLFVSLILQFLVLLVPIMLQEIVDGMLTEKNTNSITIYILITIFCIAYYTFNFFKIRFITKMQTDIDSDLLDMTIGHLLDLPYFYFINRSKGELIYRINSNSYIRQVLIEQTIDILINIIFVILYLIEMFMLNTSLSLLTILLSMLICTSLIISTIYEKKIVQKEVISTSKSQNYVSEMINNIATIKSTNSQKKIYKSWKSNFEKQIEYELKKAQYNSIFSNFSQSMQSLYTIILYLGGVVLINDRGQPLTVGNIVAFTTVGVAFLTPLVSILSSYNQLFSIKIYLNRLLDILDTTSEIEKFGKEKLENPLGDIEVRNIFFKYSKFSEEILSNISFDIKKNEKVAIIGESGSGKSTLLRLLSGFYQPISGTILYNGVSLSSFSVSSIREKVGIILQEDSLFNGTIRENITLGRNIADKKIWETLYEIKLDEFIKSFPLGLDTIISESGRNLSGGQRQKLAIVRTLVSNPNLIFLDEPTSSLDVESEKKIMDFIFTLNCTMVVVTHRISLASNFDRIIVIKNGEITGVGTHKELMSSCNYYRQLYRERIN